MGFQRVSESERAAWNKQVQDWRESGQSIAAWCRQHDLAYHAFFYWRKRFAPETIATHSTPRKEFFELEDPGTEETGVHVECSGVRISLDRNFDEGCFLRCMRALRAVS